MALKVASFHGSLEPKLLEVWKNYWHVSDTKIIQTTQKSSYFAFVKLYKGKVAGFLSSLNDFSVRHMPIVFPYLP